ncbi:LysM peptidoglycan-binding domain-containing protein [Chlamydia sp. 17-3921]|uniref:LysM peptidoglycan-binding domain-containing protein n=1 Tax=Chlamydia sp. 17-3921 TaxID=2675798 RepID=UPI00191B6432|nr:LysM peptidoglycan-binding domain-containing protein [Chlamydia sp. 17-3921]
MNRRDMVITAVLMNAMLLIVLFITSKHSSVKNYAENYQEFSTNKIVQIHSPEEVVEKQIVQIPAVSVVHPVAKETLAAQFVEEKPIVAVPQPSPVIETSETTSLQSKPIQENPKENYTTIVVKKGDFLERIARANQTTVAALMQINDLTSTQLKIGQVIKVPIINRTDNTKESSQITSSENYYIVQEGDSPWTIALRNHIRLEELLRLNNLDEQKARRLRPGDQLRIR